MDASADAYASSNADASMWPGPDGTGPGDSAGPQDSTVVEDGPAPDGNAGDAAQGCPPGATCNVSCPGAGTTRITGKVYDPAGKNPLFHVVVYVPASPLQVLPKGVATGAGACSCAALFPSGMLASTTTGVDGSFTLANVPVGTNVPLVLQVGKWRRVLHVKVTACQPNTQPDRSLTLPGTVAAGSGDNIPDIAVSTGAADTLECLLLRVGLPASEYVAGAATTGHVHIFSGGDSTGRVGGSPEMPPMPGAPASNTSLWSNQSQLMPYDVTLLSCEGQETYSANPQVLETYLNAGGRVLASHFHYSWFAGPIGTMQTYSAPSDWGTNLATWAAASNTSPFGPIGGIIDTTLNGTSTPFPKGVAFQQWLANVGALGQATLPVTELPIYQPRFNAVVGSANKPSQPWITADMSSGGAGSTMLFSFDTPVNLNPGPATQVCGRAMFTDLHAAGDPTTNDFPPPPGGCMNADLSPQEKALEFMLFDLSGCVVPDTANP
jgi:hypothetical protein